MCLQKILERVALTRVCSLKYPLTGCLIVILGVPTRQLYGLFSEMAASDWKILVVTYGGTQEGRGMMPSVISYVRLFAVGIVGVKIAETGNKLWEPMMEADAILVPVFFIGWLSVQMFAWALGVFSPNIHAARLHFVEWMRQYYDSSGEAFEPFGFRSNFVEVE